MTSLLYEEDKDSGLDPDEFVPFETLNHETISYEDEKINNFIEIDHDLMQISLSPYNSVKMKNDIKYRHSNNHSPVSPLVSTSSESDDQNIKIELLTKKSEIRKNSKVDQPGNPYSKKIVGNLFLSSGSDEHLRQLFTRPNENKSNTSHSAEKKSDFEHETEQERSAYYQNSKGDVHTEINEWNSKFPTPDNFISQPEPDHRFSKSNVQPEKSSPIDSIAKDFPNLTLDVNRKRAEINDQRQHQQVQKPESPSKVFDLIMNDNSPTEFFPQRKLSTESNGQKISPRPQSPMKIIKQKSPKKQYVISNNQTDKDVDKMLLASSIEIILSRDGSDKSEKVFDEIDALKKTEGVSKDHIVSAVGTVRGVKNRVKERLLNYLSNIEKKKNAEAKKPKQMFLAADHELAINAKSNYIFETDGKVIIYITSLGLIRKTKSDCVYVRNAFRNLMYKTEERDITDPVYRYEYCKLFEGLLPPQVIINGQHIGGRDKLELLIETGKIHDHCQNIEKIMYQKGGCPTCAGHGYVNCPRCLGSGRARTLRYSGTRELNYLKCTYCKNGLLRCFDCIDSIH